MDAQTVAIVVAALTVAQVLAETLKGMIGKMFPDRRRADDECTEAVRRVEDKLHEIAKDVLEIKVRGAKN